MDGMGNFRREDLTAADEHPKRAEMTFRLARLFHITEAEECGALEIHVRALFAHYCYKELVRPLVRIERRRKGSSLRKLTIAYGLTMAEVRTMAGV